jgi:hypothetical protein
MSRETSATAVWVKVAAMKWLLVALGVVVLAVAIWAAYGFHYR